jgi:ABC-type anion transport system duplicated permease subunit
MDLGDKSSRYCVSNSDWEVVEERSVATNKKSLQRVFGARRRYRIAIEVGTHSPWVSRLLARLARTDPQLLRPIRHRSEAAQQHRMIIRVRAARVETRTSLVNTARGLAKSVGERLPNCAADQMGVERGEQLPQPLLKTLEPLLEVWNH